MKIATQLVLALAALLLLVWGVEWAGTALAAGLGVTAPMVGVALGLFTVLAAAAVGFIAVRGRWPTGRTVGVIIVMVLVFWGTFIPFEAGIFWAIRLLQLDGDNAMWVYGLAVVGSVLCSGWAIRVAYPSGATKLAWSYIVGGGAVMAAVVIVGTTVADDLNLFTGEASVVVCPGVIPTTSEGKEFSPELKEFRDAAAFLNDYPKAHLVDSGIAVHAEDAVHAAYFVAVDIKTAKGHDLFTRLREREAPAAETSAPTPSTTRTPGKSSGSGKVSLDCRSLAHPFAGEPASFPTGRLGLPVGGKVEVGCADPCMQSLKWRLCETRGRGGEKDAQASFTWEGTSLRWLTGNGDANEWIQAGQEGPFNLGGMTSECGLRELVLLNKSAKVAAFFVVGTPDDDLAAACEAG